MQKLGLFSKRDRASIEEMMNIFGHRDNVVFFIESEVTHYWLMQNQTWTNNPHWCLQFRNQISAKTYAIKNKIENWIITEHEFPAKQV